MDDDDLDETDVQYAILHGEISSELTDDPRGIRFVVLGNTPDEARSMEVVCRFLPSGLPAYNYGVSHRGITMEKDFCEYCNAILPDVEKLVTVYRHRRGKHFIFERVSARVCTKCGERYFSAKSVQEMQREMSQATPSGHFVSVPVIELQHA